MKNELEVRREMCEIGHLLYQRNYIVGTDGNMSARFPGNVILVTPSGACKAKMCPEQLLKVDIEGRVISGEGVPSSELPMHLMVYEKRPDVRAIVHAHPPIAVAFTLAKISLRPIVIPEVAIHLGEILTAPYATPGSNDLAHSIEPLLAGSDAILLERHGIITLGRGLNEAYDKLEYVEYTAKVLLAARQLGPIEPLDEKEIETLSKIRAKRSAK